MCPGTCITFNFESPKFFHSFGINYGIVLILFAFLVRFITGPLTKKSFESTQKMQAIQPQLKKLQEKYKNDSLSLLNEVGAKKFIEIIKKFDTESLSKISSQDSSRMRRIWEVYQSTGKKYSYWINKKNKIFLKNFSNKIFLFIPPRDDIYKKINFRFNTMINEGAIEEVKKLISLNLDVSLPIMKAHGVPEITNYLCGKIDLEECIKKSQQVTRNYAKRQLTWWRSSRLSINKVFDQFPNEIDEKLIKI